MASPARPLSGVATETDFAASAAARLGDERLGPDRREERAVAGELGVDQRVAAEDGVADHELVAVDAQVGAVGDHGTIELGREASDRVAAVVALREQHDVGRLLGDERHQRRRAHHSGEGVTGVDREDLAGAVIAQRTHQRVGVGAYIDRFHRVAELARLGEQLEGRGRGLVALRFGEHPDLRDCHRSRFRCSYDEMTQMTR